MPTHSSMRWRMQQLTSGCSAPRRGGQPRVRGRGGELTSPTESVAVCDVGGGSTQLLAGTADGPAWMRPSTSSLRLTARCLHSNPPTKGELELARNEVAERLAPVTPPLSAHCSPPAAARGPPAPRGSQARPKELRRRLELAVSAPSEELAAVHGLQPARVRTLAAGALILSAAQERFGVPLKVAREGVREGAILSLLSRVEAAA